MKKLIIIFSIILVAINVNAGGLIIAAEKMPDIDIMPRHPQWPPNPIPFPTPHVQHYVLQNKVQKVDVSLNELSANTKIEQVFYNPNNQRLEGFFFFPLPEGANISEFTMDINGKETKAELLDAAKAAQIYQRIVSSMRDPALLEFSNRKLMKVKIFPIEPRSELRISLSYAQTLNKENNTVHFKYPLKNTHKDSNNIESFIFSAKLETTDPIKNIYCPTHKLEISEKGNNKATIGFEESDIEPASDIDIFYSLNQKDFGLSIINHATSNNEGFFLLNVSPGIQADKQALPKDVAFVLDASGSMSGEKMKQAKKALTFCVEHLNEEDRFQIIRFSTEANALYGSLSKANKSNLNEANEFIDDMEAIGGTNIDEALQLALEHQPTKDRPYIIVFITDGKPTVGEIRQDQLINYVEKNNENNTRIFTFGIGNDINTLLLDKITELSNAHRTYITPEEDIEVKISNFYTKISSPVLTDLDLKFTGLNVSSINPKKLPDLFNGSSLTVIGRYNKASNNTSAQLCGNIKDEDVELNYDFNLDNNSKNEFIANLWANREVGFLLDQIRLNGESDELKKEIVSLAKKYGIVTPYTSYLIVEDESMAVNRGTIRPKNQLIGNRIELEAEMEAISDSYIDMNKSSGASSVRSSSGIQNMNQAESLSSVAAPKRKLESKSGFTSANDLTNQKVSENIQMNNGRAFYLNSNVWIDELVQVNEKLNTEKIKFASEEYFTLLNNVPEVYNYLAMGNNIRFVANNRIYEIFE